MMATKKTTKKPQTRKPGAQHDTDGAEPKTTKAPVDATPAAGPLPSRVAKPIKELKPGWMSRVFHLETATLLACDAHWNGTNWERAEKFSFLYRSKRGKFFVLHDVQSWSIATDGEARRLFRELPEKLVSAERAFEPIIIEPLPPRGATRTRTPASTRWCATTSGSSRSGWPTRKSRAAGTTSASLGKTRAAWSSSTRIASSARRTRGCRSGAYVLSPSAGLADVVSTLMVKPTLTAHVASRNVPL